jgi:trk system potassium uptake protein TrkH
VGSFGSWAIEVILIAGMYLAGVNFELYNRALGRARSWWRVFAESVELRVFTSILVVSSLLTGLTLWLWGGSNGDPASDLPDYRSLGLAMRDGAFNVVNMQTCTGFATADLDRWPDSCRQLLMVLVFVGGCTGSTAGGIKVIRLVVLWKAALSWLASHALPKGVHEVRVGGQRLEPGVVTGVITHVWVWLACAALGVVVLTALGLDPVSALSAVTANLNNAGPGLGVVGPYGNYASLHEGSKLLLSVFMIFGRLEFLAILTLFLPAFWRS